MQQVYRTISKVGPTDANVLLLGGNGTGKDLAARALHTASERAQQPFIRVDLGTLTESLFESELFGHVKGAFTDAREDRVGRFELASGGSLLLDEIGDMEPSLQSKLLRVTEERTFRRVGGTRDLPVKAMVIATTNRELEQQVEQGRFRQDLFFRLNSFAMHIPPLRERGQDVLALARFFLDRFSRRYDRKVPIELSPETNQLLLAYQWPGNVRELKNAVERIVVLHSGGVILPEHLPREVLGQRRGTTDGVSISIPDEGLSLADVERDLIIQAMKKAGGNKTRAAKLLNVTYNTLRYQIKKYGLE